MRAENRRSPRSMATTTRGRISRRPHPHSCIGSHTSRPRHSRASSNGGSLAHGLELPRPFRHIAGQEPMSMIPFRKMNGLGNDFLVVDAQGGSRAAAARGDPPAGRPRERASASTSSSPSSATSSGADAFMRIDNADGGEVEACGNATRCVGWLLMRRKRTRQRRHPDAGRAAQRAAGRMLARTSDVVIAGLDPAIHSVTAEPEMQPFRNGCPDQVRASRQGKGCLRRRVISSPSTWACRNSAGGKFRSPRSSAIRAPSNCRSGRSRRRSCIRPRSPISATRMRSSGSTMCGPTISSASGRCSRTIRSSPSAPTSRSRM